MSADEAVKALLAQRKDQGYDTPSQAITERLAQLIAGTTTTQDDETQVT